MKKVLVLGATGLIGHQVYFHLKEKANYEVVAMAHTRQLDNETIQLDARDERAFADAVMEVSPNVIVNCIGVLISEAKKNPEQAVFLNAYLPHRLKRLADDLCAKLIHISTDCVFTGNRGSYMETDIKDADDVYGRAKGLGEITAAPHVTLRTSVVGPELKDGEELFHWFMQQKGTIQGYEKSLWSGVTTLELARAVEWAIHAGIEGLYHVTNGEPISKYALLLLFKKYANKVVEIEKVEGRKTDKSLVDTRHERNTCIPNYNMMIGDMVEHIRANSKLYPHYSI